VVGREVGPVVCLQPGIRADVHRVTDDRDRADHVEWESPAREIDRHPGEPSLHVGNAQRPFDRSAGARQSKWAAFRQCAPLERARLRRSRLECPALGIPYGRRSGARQPHHFLAVDRRALEGVALRRREERAARNERCGRTRRGELDEPLREQRDTGSIRRRGDEPIGRQLGSPAFVVSAVSPDGVIEAIERPASTFCLGVQWHPENSGGRASSHRCSKSSWTPRNAGHGPRLGTKITKITKVTKVTKVTKTVIVVFGFWFCFCDPL
jgi:hypothetical protein